MLITSINVQSYPSSAMFSFIYRTREKHHLFPGEEALTRSFLSTTWHMPLIGILMSRNQMYFLESGIQLLENIADFIQAAFLELLLMTIVPWPDPFIFFLGLWQAADPYPVHMGLRLDPGVIVFLRLTYLIILLSGLH